MDSTTKDSVHQAIAIRPGGSGSLGSARPMASGAARYGLHVLQHSGRVESIQRASDFVPQIERITKRLALSNGILFSSGSTVWGVADLLASNFAFPHSVIGGGEVFDRICGGTFLYFVSIHVSSRECLSK